MDYTNTNSSQMTEIIRMKSTYIFKEWIKRMRTKFPNMSTVNYHEIMNADVGEFNELKKNITWGDSFMIDKMYAPEFRFGNAGDYRIIDYPEIIIPYEGQIVMIGGVEHNIYEFGYLTFNAYPVNDNDSSNDDIEQEETENSTCDVADMAAGH